MSSLSPPPASSSAQAKYERDRYSFDKIAVPFKYVVSLSCLETLRLVWAKITVLFLVLLDPLILNIYDYSRRDCLNGPHRANCIA